MSRFKGIKNVYMLYSELRNKGLNNRYMDNGGIRKRFKIIKDGEVTCSYAGLDGYFYDKGCYYLTNGSGRWKVLYEDEYGKRLVLNACKREDDACAFFYELIAGVKKPRPLPEHRTPKLGSDIVPLEGDDECHYYWKDGVLYFSCRGSSEAVKKLDSPNKAERYLKSMHKSMNKKR